MAEKVLCRKLPVVGDQIEIYTEKELLRAGVVTKVTETTIQRDGGPERDWRVWYRITWVADTDHWHIGDVSWGYWCYPTRTTTRYRVRFLEEET